jgi:hypothetical protein
MFGKPLMFLGIYAVLHFLYEATGFKILIPFSGVDESVFEHLKLGFWAYFFANIIEYFISKKKSQTSWWYSRMFSNILLPWFIVLIWYMLPIFLGHIESLAIELVWAFAVTFVVGLISVSIERNLEDKQLSMNLKFLIVSLFVVSIIFYTAFSFQKPWIDLFENPEL